ncbi:MAG: WXG100 family type VII secretion target [Bacilli bacterium]|nr:WXG100 family type VII secretion target [Bacilli bacterium]
MAGTLKVNFDELRNTGKNILSQSEEFASLLNDIKSTNDSLKTSWQGQEASKYTTAVEMQAQNATKLNETMTEVGNYLVKAADTYQRVSEENAGKINV